MATPSVHDIATGRNMRTKVVKGIKWASILVAITVIVSFGIRVYHVQSGPPLAHWHTYVPHELRTKDLDAADWNRYLAEEARVFESVHAEVTQKLDPEERATLNRYSEGS